VDGSGAAVANPTILVDGSAIEGTVAHVPIEVFPIRVSASAPGYEEASLIVNEPPADPVRLELVPVVLTGTVTTDSGVPLPETIVHLGAVEASTGSDGSFELSPAVPGTVTFDRPAWLSTTAEWGGEDGALDVTLEPRVVRAIHAVSGLPAGDLWSPFLDIADRTEINAVVLDVKDESGVIRYASNVPLATEAGAVRASFDLGDAVAQIHDHGLYAIGRVVSFEDPIMANAQPDLAIRNGSKPLRKGSQAFLDPTDPAARAYVMDLATEACKDGFDEIQFDYIRFPTGLRSTMSLDGDGPYAGSDGQTQRVETIRSFLDEARATLHDLGCAVSADVFAIVLSTQNDQGIGQRPEDTGAAVDVLSPMVYPDHYSDGWIGFDKPADHPYAVVENALADGIGRIPPTTIMRPWIADFNYSAKSVRAEIDAAASFDLGWMLWNPGSRVTEGALEDQ
jgi:hypothetical protein